MIFSVNETTDFKVLLSGIYTDMVQIFLLLEGDENIMEESWKNYCDANPDKCNVLCMTSMDDHVFSKQMSFKHRLPTFSTLAKSKSLYQKTILQVTLKKDFIAQIAELRAMRYIWQEYQLRPDDLIIITQIDTKNDGNDVVHPLISSNYYMMSAYLGMSDFVCGYRDEDEELARLCLNIHHIFKVENHLTNVSDPVRGSYIIETLTHQMKNVV